MACLKCTDSAEWSFSFQARDKLGRVDPDTCLCMFVGAVNRRRLRAEQWWGMLHPGAVLLAVGLVWGFLE